MSVVNRQSPTDNRAEFITPLLKRLDGLVQDSPDLKGAVEYYRTILPLVGTANLLVTPVSMTPDQVRSKMEKGQPLLQGIELELDDRAAADLMVRLARALETLYRKNRLRSRRWPMAAPLRKNGEAGLDSAQKRATSAREIRLALEGRKLDVRALLRQIIAGEDDSITSVVQSLGLDPCLVGMLARYAAKPAFQAWCRQLTPLVSGIEWPRRYCFICGAGAIGGELQGNEQAKHLRCGLCGADWPFPRLRCTHCANEDHRTLGYLYPETQREKVGIEVCERCKGYLKIIAAFEPTPAEMLPVEDLATLHLDYIARERGYGRGTIG